jgi:hypothetical protein
MEESPDTPDLTREADYIAALERKIDALVTEIRSLEGTVAEQQSEVVAARELHVQVARLELENAEQALQIERMREREERRRRAPQDEEPVRMMTTLRPAAERRGVSVPELRWTAEVIVAE